MVEIKIDDVFDNVKGGYTVYAVSKVPNLHPKLIITNSKDNEVSILNYSACDNAYFDEKSHILALVCFNSDELIQGIRLKNYGTLNDLIFLINEIEIF